MLVIRIILPIMQKSKSSNKYLKSKSETRDFYRTWKSLCYINKKLNMDLDYITDSTNSLKPVKLVFYSNVTSAGKINLKEGKRVLGE